MRSFRASEARTCSSKSVATGAKRAVRIQRQYSTQGNTCTHPFGRLPVGHARIVEASCDEQTRVLVALHIIHGTVLLFLVLSVLGRSKPCEPRLTATAHSLLCAVADTTPQLSLAATACRPAMHVPQRGAAARRNRCSPRTHACRASLPQQNNPVQKDRSVKERGIGRTREGRGRESERGQGEATCRTTCSHSTSSR